MKSHESDLFELLTFIYRDAVNKCATVMPDLRDLMTIKSRVEAEGLSFLTITLPFFGSDFEQALDQEKVLPHLFRPFKKVRGGVIPELFQGILGRVFNRVTGNLLHDYDIAAIEGIRQLAHSFKKLKSPCSPERVTAAYVKFMKDELDLSEPCDQVMVDRIRSISAILWDNSFSDFNPFDCIPKHGPGATESKVSGNQKFTDPNWHDRLEPYFPLLSYKFSSENAWESKEFENVAIRFEEEEPPVRVITVPKTLKSPRIIAIEPVCMQYTQQAILAYLVRKLESMPLTSGHINFTDQSINRVLALQSSRDQSFATLDLSSASDRVSLTLVETMLHGSLLYDAMYACRSKRAKLPTGDILDLKKFASMGSALCFPVESMLFYTICIGALLDYHKLPVTYSNIKYVSEYVYVYGDDIIVPVYAVGTVTDHLQRSYCKVNLHKSFWTGKFRESCGMDAYDGEEVTPTYIRQSTPVNRRSVPSLISWVETSNLLFKKGYWLAATFMKHKCEQILGKLPIIQDTSAGLGFESFHSDYSRERWSEVLHRFEVRTWVPEPVYRTDKLTGYGALTKSLLRLENCDLSNSPIQGRDHLEWTARHGAVALKRRWVCPH